MTKIEDPVEQSEIDAYNLSLIHIGQMLEAWDYESTLVNRQGELEQRVLDTFGVDMREDVIYIARDKIMAVIELRTTDVEVH